MPRRFESSPEFQKLLDGGLQVDLFRVALEIAKDAYPELDSTSYLARLEALAERVQQRCGASPKPRKVISQINWALFVEEGFQGNRENYFDPRNSYINEVLDRKVGIPISLSVLYQAIAGRLGIILHGVNLPLHFMLRLDEGDQPWFIDAFHAGELLDRHGCAQRISEVARRTIELQEFQIQPCTPGHMVARMLRNLKTIYFAVNDFESVLPVQRRLAALAPDDPEELRDLGIICLQLDRPGEAIDPFLFYLERRSTADDAQLVSELLETARRRIARWN